MFRLNDLIQLYPEAELEQWSKDLGGPQLSGMYSGDRMRHLAALLARRERVRGVLGALGKTAMDIVTHIAKEGGAVKREEVDRVFPGQGATVVELKDALLLFENISLKRKAGWEVLCLPQEYVPLLELDLSAAETLGGFLFAQPSSYHSGLASIYSLKRETNTVAYFSLQLKEILLNPAQLKKVMSQVLGPEKKLLEKALERDGILERRDVPSHWTGALDFQSLMYREQERSPIVQLYRLGLLFPNRMYQPSYLAVPSDILALLRPPSGAGTGFTVAADSPTHLRSYGLRLIEDLRLLKAALLSQSLRTTQRGYPEKRRLGQFLSVLGVNEINYGYFLFTVGLDQGSSKADPLGQMEDIFMRWVSQWGYQESNPQRIDGGITDPQLPLLRKLLLKALDGLPTGQWVTYGDFLAVVETPQWRRAGLQVSRNYYVYSPPIAETSPRNTLETLVGESLVWLGLVEAGVTMGAGEEGKLTHIRLTPWGEYVSKRKSGAFPGLTTPAEEDRFTVLPHLEINVPPGLKPSLLTKLFGVAELSGPHTFTLTKNSIAMAMNAGLSPANIVDFLRDNAKTGVPDSVLRLLGDLGKKHGQVKVGVASTFLTVEDPHVVREILASKAFHRMSPKAVGERAVILREANPEKVLNLLKKMGHYPVMEVDERESLFWN
ncbi:MAG: helicase-associated domain-containing protein [Elusimicrobia bacterium]|nr:helicase-associated domain-containing protein [Elusimicrobiota bacterium]